MKKRNLIRPAGILRWSTAFILAGGVAGLSSCERPAEDSQAAVQARVEEPDPVQKQLETGLVENNFQLPEVGYYHAESRRFHEFSYNQFRDDRYFVNGGWQAEPGPSVVEATRPVPDELKRVEAALESEQKAVAQNPQGQGGGMGMGNMLMMYWLLSGNRGFFSPGAGFRQASAQAPAWQKSVQDERRRTGYSGGGGGGSSYRTTPSSPDSPSSTRGGFGTRSGPGSSFGS